MSVGLERESLVLHTRTVKSPVKEISFGGSMRRTCSRRAIFDEKMYLKVDLKFYLWNYYFFL